MLLERKYDKKLVILCVFACILLIAGLTIFVGLGNEKKQRKQTVEKMQDTEASEDEIDTNDLVYRSYSDGYELGEGSTWSLVEDIPNVDMKDGIKVYMVEYDSKECKSRIARKGVTYEIAEKGVYKFFSYDNENNLVELDPYLKIVFGSSMEKNDTREEKDGDIILLDEEEKCD